MLDIYSIDASDLRTNDIEKIQCGFASRLGLQTDIDESVIKPHLWDLTLIYDTTGDKQAFFVRESDAIVKNCTCITCARVQELLRGPIQPLIHDRIWSTITSLQPFNESGDRRIFLAHVAMNLKDQISTDPEPYKRLPTKELLIQIAPWVELDITTWRKIRNVTPVEKSWLLH